MKVLIIGASGMLAKPVINRFDEAGYELRLFSRNVDASMFNKTYEIVKGNVLERADLERAIEGCDVLHISIAHVNEALSTQLIVDVAKRHPITCISIITGCTVCEENRWFPMIDAKFQAEKILKESGIPYMIFRPTWFFESLDLMIKDKKAFVMGKQPNPYRWLAADDYARMLTTAYQKKEARNKIFYLFGPEPLSMKEALEKYCSTCYSEITKIASIPLYLMKMIAALSGKNELREAVSLFSYFEKVKEQGDARDTNRMLGKPEISFEEWMMNKVIEK
jgi:uncharacterized protein YbjT (DUF2867 family)